jgi:hypothetical protein
MKGKRVFFLFALTTMTALILAQGRGNGQGPRYDPAAETTLTGTIDNIETLDVMCQSSGGSEP